MTAPRIIDFHTHAFPDPVAEQAIPKLEANSNVTAALDGKVSSLLGSMDAAGITQSVVASIATKPAQFPAILDWSVAIRTDRIIPFASVHPDDPEAPDQVHRIAEAGLKGIKMHPYYQGFVLDDPRMHPIYQAISDAGLLLLMHTGFDLAFEYTRIADPVRLLNVLEAFPKLRFVASHLGAYDDWDNAQRLLIGKPIYTDVSYSIQLMPRERAQELLELHPPEFLLFGTDSPWKDQAESVEFLRSFQFGEAWERLVLFENAQRLLSGEYTFASQGDISS